MGWCLKALKEPFARRCNKEDNCSGTFWESRYKSIPLLDQSALIACMAYVDLNPIRAAIASRPEQSDYTSIQERIHLRQTDEKHRTLQQRRQDDTRPLAHSLHALAQTAQTEHETWLTPIHACMTNCDGERDNGLSPEDYFTLINETGRIIRTGKRGHISSTLAPILQRLSLNLDIDNWIVCMTSYQHMIGSALGHQAARANEAMRRKVQWIRNRCPLFASPST